MKILILLIFVLALLKAQEYTAALVFCVPLALLVGYRRAVRQNGVSMIKAGTHRALFGRF